MRGPLLFLLVLLIPAVMSADMCYHVETLHGWNVGYKAMVSIVLDRTVSYWNVGIFFSQDILSLESWKGSVTMKNASHYQVENKCYNGQLYECQCLIFEYIVRHDRLAEFDQIFTFNGDSVPACQQTPDCPAGDTADTETTTNADTETTTTAITDRCCDAVVIQGYDVTGTGLSLQVLHKLNGTEFNGKPVYQLDYADNYYFAIFKEGWLVGDNGPCPWIDGLDPTNKNCNKWMLITLKTTDTEAECPETANDSWEDNVMYDMFQEEYVGDDTDATFSCG